MKTQNINLLEAINFAMAGHTVKCRNKDATLKLKNDYLAVYTPMIPKGLKLDADGINMYKDTRWHAGDDRSIKSYYKED